MYLMNDIFIIQIGYIQVGTEIQQNNFKYNTEIVYKCSRCLAMPSTLILCSHHYDIDKHKYCRRNLDR